MRKYILILACFIFQGGVFGQSTANMDAKQKPSGNKDTANVISDKQFNLLINNQFRNLITGQGDASVGNYAALDLKESSVKFAPNIFFENGSVLSLKAEGGVTDGLLQVLDHTELNKNISIGMEYHTINKKDTMKLVYFTETRDQLRAEKEKVWKKYREDSLLWAEKQEITLLELKKMKLENKLANLGRNQNEVVTALAEAGALRKMATQQTTKDSLESVQRRLVHKRDSLEYELQLGKIKLKSLNKKIQTVSDPVYRSSQLLKIGNRRIDSLNAIEERPRKIEGFQFGWWSFGYQVRNDAFKMFDPEAEFGDQISSEKANSHLVRIRYSFYNWSKEDFKTFFFTVGVAYLIKSNFSDLSKTVINESTNHGPNIGDRTTSEKYTAYLGDLEKEIQELQFNIDFYNFLFSNNSVGLHPNLSARVPMNGELDPVFNAGLGLVFPFKDKAKKKTIVNAELYFDWVDVFKSSESTYKLFEDTNAGIRFAFPVNFHPNQNK